MLLFLQIKKLCAQTLGKVHGKELLAVSVLLIAVAYMCMGLCAWLHGKQETRILDDDLDDVARLKAVASLFLRLNFFLCVVLRCSC